MTPRSSLSLLAVAGLVFGICFACSDSASPGTGPDDEPGDGGETDGGQTDGGPPDGGELPSEVTLDVVLTPETLTSTLRRVNFAVPAPPGFLHDVHRVEVLAAGQPLATSRRALATWPDGSLRSVQLQLELSVPAVTTLQVTLGRAARGGDLSPVPVEQTLAQPDGTTGPVIWATLPAQWLSTSRVAGPAVTSAAVAGTPAATWDELCDDAAFGVEAFLANDTDPGSWLYDRPTALYRGYQRNGSLSTLRSAYREAALYRAGLTGAGTATRIGVPASESDLKYHYTQGLALHYLLTGDERFREAAENVAERAHELWLSPEYQGGADFWTERHAGFALLAYEWAAAVSDDKAAQYHAWSKAAVDAYLAQQETFPAGYTDTEARCFAHEAEAHGETYGYVGCSPWMSAILADGLDAYADRLQRSNDAAGAATVRTGLVKLGRFTATQGRDPEGRPFYWAGVGNGSDELDDYDEHWGESAYLVALAWHWSGRSDAALKTAADELLTGFATLGEVGQLRSFNWQCRTGGMGAFYLQP